MPVYSTITIHCSKCGKPFSYSGPEVPKGWQCPACRYDIVPKEKK